MKIGKIIRYVRTRKEIAQGDLAKVCNISQTYLSQIENDLKMPSNTTINKIARKLQIPVSVLFYLSIEERDIPKNRLRAYKELSPTIEALIKSVYM